ncbi:secretin N-terminal domain-containing protein [Roseateles chitinivorans]|uniref:secretin N-terminal domain-containing protein n=1 Tax=Roseateles chitinivorans TaxID=2917965 RepID=UPI003D66603B
MFQRPVSPDRSDRSGVRRRSAATARTAAGALALLMLLAGCAENRIRDESRKAMAGGQYREAMSTLENGLRDYPESTALRTTLLQARSEAQMRLISQALTQRAAGQFDDAAATLRQALELDPTNARVQALLSDMELERKGAADLAVAQKWVEAKQPDRALRVLEQALKDNPRHGGLQDLQRRLLSDQRSAQVQALNGALTESRPISLDFRDASLRTVLDVVTRHSGINFVLDRDVRADVRVTVLLRQAKVEDALDLITASNQLAKKVIDPRTIVIYPNTAEKHREYQEQLVRVFNLANSDPKGAAAFLKAMLKIREPFVDERSNLLALRDSPENIQLAERLLAVFDSAEPEVLLEVEVLEVNATRLTELGVKLPTSFSLTPLPTGDSSQLTLADFENLGRNRIGVGLNPGNILVNLRREVGDSSTLANPKLRVRNKEKAKIMIGDKIPVVSTTTGTGGFVSENISYLDVGLKLDVEPTVFADDEVAIKVALEVSSLGTSIKTSAGSIAYQIGTRNATTLLRLRDGETQLLAGLISRDERATSSRVPGLGDLPVLGRLFSSQLDDGKRSELLLAITPRVLRNVKRLNASESEMWVGTEASPKLRQVGGLQFNTPQADAKPAVPGVPGAPGASGAPVAPGAAGTPGVPAPGTPGVAGPSGVVGALPAPGQPGGADPASRRMPALSLAAPPQAKVGDTVEVRLDLRDANLRGLMTELQYSADKLTLVDADEDDYFRKGGAVTSFSKRVESGRVNLSVLRNQATAADGTGSVFKLRFKAAAAGRAEVRVGTAQPVSLEPNGERPTLPAPAVIEVK